MHQTAFQESGKEKTKTRKQFLKAVAEIKPGIESPQRFAAWNAVSGITQTDALELFFCGQFIVSAMWHGWFSRIHPSSWIERESQVSSQFSATRRTAQAFAQVRFRFSIRAAMSNAPLRSSEADRILASLRWDLVLVHPCPRAGARYARTVCTASFCFRRLRARGWAARHSRCFRA